jgi:dCMP deaminase
MFSDVGFPNACAGACAKSGQDLHACEAIHAEQNALLQCRDVYQIDTAYVTASPCIHCMKLLMNTSCKRIVASSLYDQAAIDLWLRTPGRTIEINPGFDACV